ncbi:MAG: PAS domain S-box protein, partial [Nitrospinae bacterium]|nr:PAS domain S-box protein [Nitrospinota bacterium]
MKGEASSQQSMASANGSGDLTSLPAWAGGGWSWVWVVLSGVTLAASVFAIWELLERRYFPDLDARPFQNLSLTRGIGLAVILVAWAVCIIMAQRRSGLAHLRRSEQKYHQLIEDAHDAIVMFTPQGIVLEWNPQAARLFGYARSEVIGHPLPTLATDGHARFFDFLQGLVDGREESGLKYAGQRVTKGGEALDVSLSLFPLRDAPGKVIAFMETSCDIR